MVNSGQRDNVVVQVRVEALLEEHGGAFELAEKFAWGAFDGFDHGFVVFCVYADFEEPFAGLEVVGFVEADFSCAELAEAEVEP